MKKKLLALFLCCVMVFSLVPMAFTTAYAAGNGLQIYGSNGAVAETVLLKMTDKTALTAVAATGSGSYQWQIHVSGDVWANIVGTNGNTLELSYALVANLLNGDTAEIRCKLTDDAGTDSYSNTVTVQIQQSTAARKAPAAAPAVGTVISGAQPLGDPVITPAEAPSNSAPAANDAPAAESAPAANDTPAADTEPAANDAPAADSEAVVNDAPAAESGDAAPADAGDPAPQDDPAPASDVPVNDPAPVNDIPTNDVPADETPANDTPTPTTYTILINYQFADGKQAAPSWSATVAAGSTYAQDIQSPVVVGYTADQLVVHVEASEAKTYTVTYQPAEVEFTVKHFQQNVSNDNYTPVNTETKKGFTESAVGEGLAKTDYTGFYSLLYDTTTKIAADGSTVVEIYYDRYYYLMNFDLDGGYGVEPIYARYGAAISVDTSGLKKAGYTFAGWDEDKEIPTTMPAANTSYKANWTVGEAGFTVVFWYENANPNAEGKYEYSVAGTYKPADVAPGTQKKSADYKKQNFDGRDDKHFTYNENKTETVTVKGDGSTVLNVYYTRNTYTLTFKNAVLNCGKVEHSHSHSQCCTKNDLHLVIFIPCNTDKCPYGYKHSHSSSCYKDLTITAKYQADIHGNFPIKDGNNTIWWKVPQGTETYGNLDEQRYLGSIDTMPGENITFEKKDSESGAKIYYYVETINGAAGDTTYKGRNYKQYKVIDLDYSDSVSLTYREEFHPITGFTQGDSNPYLPKDGSVGMERNNYLYYTRNSYNLKFYNYNAYVTGKGGSVQYEAPLSSYYFEPEYPANLEKNAYVFDGWYTTAAYYEGSKADLSTMTMPASDVILYAKWVPKTHTVKTYLTKDAMGGEPLNTWEEVPHGTAVENPPAEPKNGQYTFVGWFYISDTGEEKAFDFSMPVNRDLNLYAKWSSNTLMNYTIRYAIENADGTLTYIADDTTGSALAGSTKTFNAKTGTQLNEGYQSGYFPKVSSHSITMDIEDASKNEFTFVYVAKEEVEYTVKYLEKGTEKQLAEPKTVKTRDAVVTEPFKQIKGYAPDAYQKQLVLAAEGNVITFWYVKDEIHAPVQVIHWTQNIEGEGYTEYQSSTNLNGVIGQEYPESPLTIPGFTYVASKSTDKGTLTAAGLVLNLYYDRNEYPYEFRFLEQGTDKVLADPVTGSARYQAQVTQTAKTIPGYTLVSAENQAIHIAIEDGTAAVKNVKTFYYTEKTVEIKYVPVGPAGAQNFGSVDPTSETVKIKTGTAAGSTPTAGDGFKFAGWYKDEACTEPVTGANWIVGNVIKPQKENGMNIATTYYAKFEYDVADLTITKEGCSAADQDQAFIFTITGPDGYRNQAVIKGNGSVTIKGLKIGEYTIHEESGWSWRYSCADQKVTLKGGADVINSVTMSNSRGNDKWLDNSASADNIFTGAK